MLNTLAAALSILIGAVLLAGCASGPGKGPEPRPLELGALVGEWRLESIEGYDALPAGVRPPTLRFDEDGSVSGFSGVNRLSTSLDLAALEEGAFAIGPAASTRMAGPQEAMDLEHDFLTLLQEASEGRVTADTLVLGADGEDLLTFRRAE